MLPTPGRPFGGKVFLLPTLGALLGGQFFCYRLLAAFFGERCSHDLLAQPLVSANNGVPRKSLPPGMSSYEEGLSVGNQLPICIRIQKFTVSLVWYQHPLRNILKKPLKPIICWCPRHTSVRIPKMILYIVREWLIIWPNQS